VPDGAPQAYLPPQYQIPVADQNHFFPLFGGTSELQQCMPSAGFHTSSEDHNFSFIAWCILPGCRQPQFFDYRRQEYLEYCRDHISYAFSSCHALQHF
jgi:hypothetical protein